MPAARLPFGKSIVLPGLLNWLSTIGWDGINSLFGAYALTILIPGLPFVVGLLIIVLCQGALGIFGYEAMSAVLAVLREAGSAANNRSTVVHAFLAIKNRQSVLGTYSMNSSGDTSIAPFVFSRLQQGKLVPFAQVQG